MTRTAPELAARGTPGLADPVSANVHWPSGVSALLCAGKNYTTRRNRHTAERPGHVAQRTSGARRKQKCMTNTDKPYIVLTQETARPLNESTYLVAVNDEGQHAVWQAELALPVGWRQESAVMPKRACLAAIAAAWQDIAPVSVRGAERETGPPDATRRGAEASHAISRTHKLRYVTAQFQQRPSARPDPPPVVPPGPRR